MILITFWINAYLVQMKGKEKEEILLALFKRCKQQE